MLPKDKYAMIPKSFDGRKVWEKFLSPIKNQGYCGMCYATSTVGSLADRYALFTNNNIHVDLSASSMVMCLTTDHTFTANVTIFGRDKLEDFRKQEIETRKQFACDGNTLYNAAKYLFVKGVPTTECIPDKLVSNITRNENLPFCEDVQGVQFDTCADKVTSQKYYRALRVYKINYEENDINTTEKQIMYDIYKWGPISAGFLMHDDFLKDYDGKTIYTKKGVGNPKIGHAIRIVGWGEEENQSKEVIKYWICANSWSDEWGENGYFKIQRFLEGFDLEKNIVSLIPDLPNVSQMDILMGGQSLITKDDMKYRNFLGVCPQTLYSSTSLEKIRDGFLKGDIVNNTITSEQLPISYDQFYAAQINTQLFIDKTKTKTKTKNIIITIIIIGLIIIGVIIFKKCKCKCKM